MAVLPNLPLAYLSAILAPLAGSLLILQWHSALDSGNAALFYTLAVVLIATRFGRGPAVLGALCSATFLAWLFPPKGVVVGDIHYLLSVLIMLAVALLVGHVTSRRQEQAGFAERRSRQSRTLYELSQELASVRNAEAVAAHTGRFLVAALGTRQACVIFPADFAAPPAPATAAMIESCIGCRELCRQPLADGCVHVLLPLSSTSGIQGVLGFEIEAGRLEGPEAVQYLETIASVVSVALERSRFAELAQASEVRHAGEMLRSSILGALSHDLRTPLAALVSMADTAALGKASPERQRHLLEAIRNQAMSISQQMMNLLEMAKLSSGTVELDRAWQPIEEAVGSALKLIRTQWKDREISVDLAPGLPPVCIDAVLIERVLWNLLENAIKYSPADAMTELAIRRAGEQIEICVSDSGPGLPEGDSGRLFNVFQRGRAESDIAGVGLGLAIAQTIVEAHAGEISAANRLGGGACFRVALPIGNPPDIWGQG